MEWNALLYPGLEKPCSLWFCPWHGPAGLVQASRRFREESAPCEITGNLECARRQLKATHFGGQGPQPGATLGSGDAQEKNFRETLKRLCCLTYSHDPGKETEIEAAHMTTVFLDHPLLLAVCLFVFLMAVVETGFRLAVLTGANLDDDSREQIAASRDSLGILLSFMLGFTLAMALPRFDLRKHLVMAEANAIGTTSLPAALFPDPQPS